MPTVGTSTDDKSAGCLLTGPSHRRKVLFLFLVACALRLIVGFVFIDSLGSDPDAYRRIAKGLYSHSTLGLFDDQASTVVPTAYRPPLFPWLLSGFQGLSTDRYAIAMLHALLGALTTVLSFDIARRVRLDDRGALVAAVLVLLDPILLRQSTLVMTETTATLLGVAIWWLALVLGSKGLQSREHSLWTGAILGIALGVACLCRPTAVAWCILWVAVDLFRNPSRACSLALGCILILTPWWIRNLSQLGQGVWTTTHGGYTLLLANNPILYEHWQTSSSREWDEDRFHAWWAAQKLQKFGSAPPNEIELDRYANALGIQTIRDNPLGFAKACLIREGWLWAWWPSQRQSSLNTRTAICIWYALSTTAALFGLSRLVRSDRKGLSLWTAGLTLAASLCLVHAIYWSNMRMRAPMIPLVSLLAVSAYKRPENQTQFEARTQ
jgi:4-amino-4-deoxy-L-arabinose transferase-like glycosyltransferase